MILTKDFFLNMKIKFFFLYLLFFSFNVLAFDKNNIIINGDILIDESVIFSIIDNNLITDSLTDFDSNIILDDIYKTGLFSNVEINIINNKLVINLISVPLINKINFSGNDRFKDDDFYEIINRNFDLTYYNKNEILIFIKELDNLYKSFGYNQIEISFFVNDSQDNNLKSVDLNFEFIEGSISKINKVSFIGNSSFPDHRLLEQIKSKPRNSILFFTKRNFKLFETKNDLQKLIIFYKEHGFRDVKMQTSYEYIDEKNFYNIIFSIDEGSKYQFSDINLKLNNILLNDDQLNHINENFNIYRDKYILNNNSYNPKYYDKLKLLLTDILFDYGLKFFNIEISESLNNLSVDTSIIINPSLPKFINQIQIVGNTRTYDEVIRRELLIIEGDAVNDLIIQQSLKNLQSLNIFESIDIKQNIINETSTDIEINVKEKPTGSFQVGLSVGSLDGYSLILGLNEKNIGGSGRNVSTMINSSAKNTEYSLYIVEPHIYNKKIDLIYGIGYIEKDLISKSSYKLDTLESNIGLQYDLTSDIFHRITLDYVLKKYTVSDISEVSTSIANSQGSNAEIKLKNSLTYNSLNSFIRPSKGLYSKFTNILSPVTNSDNGYVKNIFVLRKYYELDKSTFSIQSTIGNVISLQNTNIDNDNKFSLGGRWLRGFDSFGAGPRNSSSAYIGGNNIFVTKFDLSRPLLSNQSDSPIDLNLFTDIGKVFGNKDDPTSSKETIRASYGVGLKFYTPIGPIGLSWSFPIKSESYDIKRSFLFSIGDLN